MTSLILLVFKYLIKQYWHVLNHGIVLYTTCMYKYIDASKLSLLRRPRLVTVKSRRNRYAGRVSGWRSCRLWSQERVHAAMIAPRVHLHACIMSYMGVRQKARFSKSMRYNVKCYNGKTWKLKDLKTFNV